LSVQNDNRERPKTKRKEIGALHLKDVVDRPGTLCNVSRRSPGKGRTGHRRDIFASCTSHGEQTFLPTSGFAEELNQIAAGFDETIEECYRCRLPTVAGQLNEII
jgi:hypothetical protein